jgi:TonB family protein
MKKNISYIITIFAIVFIRNSNAQQRIHEELVNSNAGVKTISGNDTIRNNSDNVFIQVEEMPIFPGGKEGLMNFMVQNLNYPKTEKDSGIMGTVYVYFIINKEGKVFDSRVVRGVKNGQALDTEALRVINSMPSWTPGKNNGRLVNVAFTLPVKFHLNETKK